jgi:hypothetical protein
VPGLSARAPATARGMLAEPDVDRAVVAAATRPIAGLQERCAEFLGRGLLQLERRLRPDAYGRVRGGYIARRPPAASSVGATLSITLLISLIME